MLVKCALGIVSIDVLGVDGRLKSDDIARERGVIRVYVWRTDDRLPHGWLTEPGGQK